VFQAAHFAPFLLEEFVGSGQYLDQLEKLAERLADRAAAHNDDFVRVVDAGCNVGFFGLFADQILGPVSVTGFDPLPVNAEMAAENLGKAGVPHAMFPCALGATTGTATFHVMSSTGSTMCELERDLWESETGHDAYDVDIDVFALDGCTVGRVDLLKLDVEGAEEDVLRGARELLERDRPFVICSYEHPSNDVQAIVGLMGGYSVEDDEVNRLLTFSPLAP